MPINPPFSLRWNNYSRHITNAFDSLRSQEDFVDVTLCCEGRKIRAHKMLLSVCSTYFKEIFKENPCQHPVIVFKNVKYDDLFGLIEFMYQGEVRVEQASLQSFLNTAEILSIEGLTQENGINGYGSVAETLNPDKVNEIINNNTDNSGKTTTTIVPIKITAILDSNLTETFEIPSETIPICQKQNKAEAQQQQQQQQPKIIVKKYFSTSLQKQNPQQCENVSELECQEKRGMVQGKTGTAKTIMTPKRSGVWSHYKYIRGISRARCCTCSKMISYKGGGISNLKKHLKSKHPHIDSTAPTCVYDNLEEQSENQFKAVNPDADNSIDSGDTTRNQIETTMTSKRSGVWSHYKVFKSIERARCCACNKMLSYKGGGVSNLRKHLISKHPHIDTGSQKFVHDNLEEQPEKQFQAVKPDAVKKTKMTPKRSGVWAHYKCIRGISRARCCTCSKMISYKGGGVSNLRKHLKTRHPHIDSTVPKFVFDNVEEQLEKRFKSVNPDTDNSNDSGETTRNQIETTMTSKRSGVWFHYKDFKSIERARCCTCNKMLSYKGGGVSNLRKHLISKHPHIDTGSRKFVHDNLEEQPEKQFQAVESDTDNSNASTGTSRIQTDELDYLKMETEYFEAMNDDSDRE